MATDTIVLAGGRHLTGRLVEHCGRGRVVIELDGRRYAGLSRAAHARQAAR